jgi:hypothetical protein
MNYWNTKTQKKWQKTFITNVFAQKTKRDDTYSKIIINNPELLNDKNTHIPKTLFKFYAPTSDNIFDIKKQRLWCSHPSSFNDPFDCHTGYDIDNYEKFSILDHIKKVGFVKRQMVKADLRKRIIIEYIIRVRNIFLIGEVM